MVTFISRNPEETQHLGEQWGQLARPGWVIGLTGDLGAGKTQIVIGLARGLGVSERVLSPTFNLVHEYKTGRLPLFHLDLYRLETAAQIVGAGLEEYLEQSSGVAVIEWADRWFGDLSEKSAKPAFLPAHFRSVRIETMDEAERRISYEDFGA